MNESFYFYSRTIVGIDTHIFMREITSPHGEMLLSRTFQIHCHGDFRLLKNSTSNLFIQIKWLTLFDDV